MKRLELDAQKKRTEELLRGRSIQVYPSQLAPTGAGDWCRSVTNQSALNGTQTNCRQGSTPIKRLDCTQLVHGYISRCVVAGFGTNSKYSTFSSRLNGTGVVQYGSVESVTHFQLVFDVISLMALVQLPDSTRINCNSR